MTTHSQTSLDTLTVGEIAATVAGATAVFREFKVNFCCRGDVAFSEAARQHGIDAAALTTALHALAASETAVPTPPDTDALIDHILTRYHETHRRELPELVELARKVEAVHADHAQAPHGLADLLWQMQAELQEHMHKEELILFPMMRRGAGVRLDAPIAKMRHDHELHGEHLRRLEDLTNGFTAPEGACRTWQALCAGTTKLAEDLMEHIHLENNVLFPRFREAAT